MAGRQVIQPAKLRRGPAVAAPSELLECRAEPREQTRQPPVARLDSCIHLERPDAWRTWVAKIRSSCQADSSRALGRDPSRAAMPPSASAPGLPPHKAAVMLTALVSGLPSRSRTVQCQFGVECGCCALGEVAVEQRCGCPASLDPLAPLCNNRDRAEHLGPVSDGAGLNVTVIKGHRIARERCTRTNERPVRARFGKHPELINIR